MMVPAEAFFVSMSIISTALVTVIWLVAKLYHIHKQEFSADDWARARVGAIHELLHSVDTPEELLMLFNMQDCLEILQAAPDQKEVLIFLTRLAAGIDRHKLDATIVGRAYNLSIWGKR